MRCGQQLLCTIRTGQLQTQQQSGPSLVPAVIGQWLQLWQTTACPSSSDMPYQAATHSLSWAVHPGSSLDVRGPVVSDPQQQFRRTPAASSTQQHIAAGLDGKQMTTQCS